jgi:hypothetical protein
VHLSTKLIAVKKQARTLERLTLLSDVNADIYAKGRTPAIEQEPTDLEQEIQARARKIRAMPVGERIYAQGSISGRIRTMEKNIERGYSEWVPQLEAEKRVLELSKLGMVG